MALAGLTLIAPLFVCASADSQRTAFQYRVWSGAPRNAMVDWHDATYVFDEEWQLRAVQSDNCILSRASRTAIRLTEINGKSMYRLPTGLRQAECNAGPLDWTLSPSGRLAACVAGNYPDQTIHFIETVQMRPFAIVRVPDAFITGRNKIAFQNDERLLYAAIDHSCPRETFSRLPYSVVEMSLTKRYARRTIFRCASGVITGTSRLAYLRENAREYTVDGKHWISDELYAFDREDNVITNQHPAIKAFFAQHANRAVWLISAGEPPRSR